MNKKSLIGKLMEKISHIAQVLKEKQEAITTEKLMEHLQEGEYKRTPKETLLRVVKDYINEFNPQGEQFSVKQDVQQKLNSLNKSLPYTKRTSQQFLNQNQGGGGEDNVVEELERRQQKKVKRESQNGQGGTDENQSSNDFESQLEKILGIEDLGGFDVLIENLKQQIYLPLKNHEIFEKLNINPPKGILLTGPTGSGKTAVGLAICKDIYMNFGHPIFYKPSTEFISGVSGDSEKNLRNLFKDASNRAPSIIFIDEIDAIAGSRDKASKEMEKRVVSELLSCLDILPHNVFVIAATSRPETLESAIRRGGRFDNEVLLTVPDEKQRLNILQKLTKKVPLNKDIDLSLYAKNSPGYVPADLVSLISKAGVIAVQRIVETQAKLNKLIDLKKPHLKSQIIQQPQLQNLLIQGQATSQPTEQTLSQPVLQPQVQPVPAALTLGQPIIQPMSTAQTLSQPRVQTKVPSGQTLGQPTGKTLSQPTAGGVKTQPMVNQNIVNQNIVNQNIVNQTMGNQTMVNQNMANQNIVGIENMVEGGQSKTIGVQDEIQEEDLNQNLNLDLNLNQNLNQSSDIYTNEGEEIEEQTRPKEEKIEVEGGVYELVEDDLKKALLQVQPTGKREGFATIPNVQWHDIGGLQSLKDELTNNIILPILQPEKFEAFNINTPAGVLLYGPPGCGKTLLAKAVANASKANFIAVKGPELLNKYVGESERAVRSVFQRAKASMPCIIFFDEIDAICPKRGTDGNQVTERVVNSLLAEMDGFENRRQVYVIAATNRPDIIDPAMLRGGRLEKLLYVPLPDKNEKLQILKALTRNIPIRDQDELKKIAFSQQTDGFTGADLGFFIKEAALISILNGKKEIHKESLHESLKKIRPSLSEEDRISYEMLQSTLQQAKGHIRRDTSNESKKKSNN